MQPPQRAHQRAAERVAGLLRGDQVQLQRPRLRHHGGLPMPKTKTFSLSAAAATACGSAMMASPATIGDAGKPGARRFGDGARPDGRQIDAAILVGLRRLDQHADAGRRRNAAARAQLRDPRQHGVGALGGLDRKHVIVRHHGRLPDVVRARSRCSRPSPCVISARSCGVGARLPTLPAGIRISRRDLVGADDAKTAVLENPHHAREQMIVAAAIDAPDPRQQPEHLPVDAQRAERRPHRRADERDVAAALVPGAAQEAPDLRDREPAVRIFLDQRGVGPAADREQHDAPAAAR